MALAGHPRLGCVEEDERIPRKPLPGTPLDLSQQLSAGLALPHLLKALGIDEQALARAEPLVLRDMERVCTLCQDEAQCDRDLAAGASAEHYRGYCLNASMIDILGQDARK
jgi:hypothetical protein